MVGEPCALVKASLGHGLEACAVSSGGNRAAQGILQGDASRAIVIMTAPDELETHVKINSISFGSYGKLS